MDSRTTPSGGSAPDAGLRPSPIVLRLLPHVHHPPARVLVLAPRGARREVEALEARGYRVVTAESIGFPDHVSETGFDLACECGLLAALAPDRRVRYAAALSHALRPGGKLFGAFLRADEPDRSSPPWGIGASELTALLSATFDVERLEPSDFASSPASQFEAVFSLRS